MTAIEKIRKKERNIAKFKKIRAIMRECAVRGYSRTENALKLITKEVER